MKDIHLGKVVKQIPSKVSALDNFENTKFVYDKYIKRIEKTDFANSITRYEVELKLLNSMKESAEQLKMTKEIKAVEEKINFAKTKLEEFGITEK